MNKLNTQMKRQRCQAGFEMRETYRHKESDKLKEDTEKV